ncbi:hypothetical protein GCM10028821_09670 [Hymenobacter jeollabukensis]
MKYFFASILVTTCGLAVAQTPAAGAGAVPASAAGDKPDIKNCYQVVRNDSIRLFYDATYTLTPPACASIRRLTRLTADGNFTGEVRDYWIDENVLALRVRYVDGKAEGLVEQFHRNGKPAFRGPVARGIPTGDWQYWYDTGQPWQVLRFPSEGGFRIVAYWDSTGAQRATEGSGYWEGYSLPNAMTSGDKTWVVHKSAFRFRGPIADGRPNGRWESIETRNGKVFTTENFVQGRFRSGQLATKPRYGSTTLSSPEVVLEVEAPNVPAERFRLGPTCAEREQQQRRREFIDQAELPRHTLEHQAYGGQLMKKILSFSSQAWYAQLPDRTPVVCGIDSLGKVAVVLSASGPLQSVVKDAVLALPDWKPATIKGHYALGGFILWVDRVQERAELNPMISSGPRDAEMLRKYCQAVLDQNTKKVP